MLGYNKERRNNYFHFLEIKKWVKLNWIDEITFEKINETLRPRYEQTHLFVGIGLFMLTCIIISAGIGFAALIFSDIIDSDSIWIPSVLASLALLFILQKYVIQEKQQFASGADEATLYASLLFFTISFFLLFDNGIDEPLVVFIYYFFLFGLPAYFYKDRLLTACASFSLYAVVFFTAFKLGGFMTLFIPFLLMGFAAGSFKFSLNKLASSDNSASEKCWEVVHWISIAVFYLGGNYLVVMELSTTLDLADAFPLFVKIIFIILTALIPIGYIYFGLKKRNLALLNIGLIAVTASIMTARYYHQVMPIEYELILGGVILLGIVWFALKYWKEDKMGITIKPDADLDSGLKIESLVLDQTFGKIEGTSTFSGDGGKFGGGGASGNF